MYTGWKSKDTAHPFPCNWKFMEFGLSAQESEPMNVRVVVEFKGVDARFQVAAVDGRGYVVFGRGGIFGIWCWHFPLFVVVGGIENGVDSSFFHFTASSPRIVFSLLHYIYSTHPSVYTYA
jgi:hypothetical protein